jgi:hypothetical protein
MIAKKKKFHFKVTYPDGDIEYWYDELRRYGQNEIV